MDVYKREIINRLIRNPNRSISDKDKEICKGLHFCPDWDYDPIFKEMSEWECCTCDKEVT